MRVEAYIIARRYSYAYSRFCQLFREFERRLSPVMRQQHVAGHKAFVDYSGKLVPITDLDLTALDETKPPRGYGRD